MLQAVVCAVITAVGCAVVAALIARLLAFHFLIHTPTSHQANIPDFQDAVDEFAAKTGIPVGMQIAMISSLFDLGLDESKY